MVLGEQQGKTGGRSLKTDLQNELIAGVSTVEFRAGDSELPVRQGGGSGVPVAHLPERLFIARHGVHTLGKTTAEKCQDCDMTTTTTISQTDVKGKDAPVNKYEHH